MDKFKITLRAKAVGDKLTFTMRLRWKTWYERVAFVNYAGDSLPFASFGRIEGRVVRYLNRRGLSAVNPHEEWIKVRGRNDVWEKTFYFTED